MNVEFINPFLTSLVNVLSMMAQTQLKAEKPRLKKDEIALGDVSGMIGMIGPQTKGSLSISFEESLALEIMEKMKSWKIITENGIYLNNKWKKIAKENKLKIDIYGLASISKFEIISDNFMLYKTYITQQMLKKGFLASNSVYLSIYHNKRVLNNYLDNLNDIFYLLNKCEKNEKTISELLKFPVVKSPFKRLN